jgi:hypothetical protein
MDLRLIDLDLVLCLMVLDLLCFLPPTLFLLGILLYFFIMLMISLIIELNSRHFGV